MKSSSAKTSPRMDPPTDNRGSGQRYGRDPKRFWNRARRAWHRRFGRTPALLRWLGVAPHPEPPTSTGVVIVQIDGLSHGRLQNAIARRRMPFLKRLVARHLLVPHAYLSEIPTSTPAFHAGIFYGDNSNIPGFQFYDKALRRVFKMGQTASAQTVQAERPGPGLLKGGTVYSCVYDGGAEGSLFIFSSLLDPRRWRFALRVWDLLVLLLVHLDVALRIVFLTLLEVVWSLLDLPLQFWRTGRLWHEIKVVGIRVGLLVLGREMITLNASMDILRGVPIVYLNYLGYDENAHIRGPESAAARLSQRAIDRCIRRLVEALIHSDRLYDLYVLSDHGQAACVPFEKIAGMPIGEFVLGQLSNKRGAVESLDTLDRQSAMAEDQAAALHALQQAYPRPLRKPVERVASVLVKQVQDGDAAADAAAEADGSEDLIVAVSGPIAHVYWPREAESLLESEIEAMEPGLVERLAKHEGIGCVSVRGEQGEVHVYAANGQAVLHADGTRTVSGDMPVDRCGHAEHAYRGIHRVTLMPRAGDLVLWGNGAPAGEVSFVYENGCHSGWSREETEAFVLAPPGLDSDFSSVNEHADMFRIFSQRYRRGGSDAA